MKQRAEMISKQQIEYYRGGMKGEKIKHDSVSKMYQEATTINTGDPQTMAKEVNMKPK